MRLFRGESMDGVSRENGVTVSTLTKWREDFIAAGIAGLKKRVFEEARIAQLEKKIGQQAMELELLKKKRIGSRGETGVRRSEAWGGQERRQGSATGVRLVLRAAGLSSAAWYDRPTRRRQAGVKGGQEAPWPEAGPERRGGVGGDPGGSRDEQVSFGRIQESPPSGAAQAWEGSKNACFGNHEGEQTPFPGSTEMERFIAAKRRDDHDSASEPDVGDGPEAVLHGRGRAVLVLLS